MKPTLLPPDLSLVLTPEGVYRECHARDGSGLGAEQMLGRRIEEVLPEDVARLFRASIAQASRAGQLVEIEYELSVGRETREYEAHMVCREDGAIACNVRDITQRKKAAGQLRESEERFRGAFEHSAIGMALIAPDGRWLRSNAANCRILGYSEAELRSMRFGAVTHPEDIESNLQEYRRALSGEIDHYELEKRYIHKDGHTVPTLLTVSVVRDESGLPLYFVSQLQDLTERKRAQLEIERLRVDLAHAGRVALMGQLTASLTHQLLQPLAAIHANTETCQQLVERRAIGRAELQRALEDVHASCLRAVDVVNNVRSMLRKEPAVRRPVNLNELVKQIIEVTRQDMLVREMLVTTRLAPDAAEISGNPVELQQVILNLLLNAAEALAGVASPREITIETRTREQEVELAVHDSGIDVDPSLLQRIFEPFFTTKSKGMGIGLTICSEIVRAHGGRIWAEVNPRGGLSVRCAFASG